MKALLLDFGGTIDTDGVHWNEKFSRAYRETGIVLPRNEFDAAYRRAEAQMGAGIVGSEDGLHRTLLAQVTLQFVELGKSKKVQQSDLPAQAIVRIADSCFRDVRETVQRQVPLLLEWSGCCALALVSNFYGNLEAVVQDLGVARYFRTVIDSAVVGVRKPDPRIFQIALEALGCAPDEALVVGDSYDRDIVPAKSLGCKTVWLRSGNEELPAEQDRADIVIPSLTGLTGILSERIAHEDRT